MVVKASGPARRVGSKKYQYESHIPVRLRGTLAGRVFSVPTTGALLTIRFPTKSSKVRFGLETTDARLAGVRYDEADSFVKRCYQMAEATNLRTLTNKQIAAFEGEFYSAWSRGPDGPGTRMRYNPRDKVFVPYAADDELERQEIEMEQEAAVRAGQQFMAMPLEKRLSEQGARYDELVLRHGYEPLDPESRIKLMNGSMSLLGLAQERAGREALRDYTPDTNRSRFPDIEPPSPRRGSGSLGALVAAWWTEAKVMGLSSSTYESYANSFRLLNGFLKGKDAALVTEHDIILFKDWRLTTANTKTGKPTSPKTVKASDLTAFRSVFQWAKENRLLSINPAAEVTIKLGKRVKLRERDFTPEEARNLLVAASGLLADVRSPSPVQFARRWVPWLCAYTGARLGEIVQLRKEDVTMTPEGWVLRITPEAGTVKTKEFRDVPIHTHLVEMGFCAFAETALGPYLFMSVKPNKSFAGTWQGVKNRLAEFARAIVPDPNVAPNHGWRHTFKSKGFEAGIQEKVLDAICGHAPASVGRTYGSVSLKTKIDAMKLFPRYEVEAGSDDHHEA